MGVIIRVEPDGCQVVLLRHLLSLSSSSAKLENSPNHSWRIDVLSLSGSFLSYPIYLHCELCLQILKGNPERPEVITVKQRDMRKKMFDKRANAADGDMNMISLKDIVRVRDGPLKVNRGIATPVLFIPHI